MMTINTPETFEQPAEPVRAAVYAALVLVTLGVAKSLGGLAWVGQIALTGAVLLQLWLPLSRCDAWGVTWAALGLDTRHLRAELADAATWAAVVLPLYACGMAWLYTRGADGLVRMLGPSWQGALPVAHWGGVPWPEAGMDRLQTIRVCLEAVATHIFGVALPEEAFFRGYVQAQWQKLWPLRRPGGIGRAALAACALFALGHFVGEWHPGRLLPFFPGLMFAWQRNRRGSLIGCIVLHASCNLFSAGWAACFVPAGASAP